MHESEPKAELPVIDPVKAYFREIGRIPLIDQAKEIELAQRRDRGLEALEFLENAQDIQGAEIYARELEILDGEVAKRELAEANLRLVVSVAKKYQHKGLPLLDLIQEGNTGLIRATEKFDWKKGFKFSTYATWWIRQAITRSIKDTGNMIRIPVHMGEEISRMMLLERDEILRTGKDVLSDTELCELVGVDMDRLDKLRELKKLNSSILSLDVPLHSHSGDNASDNVLGDYIADTSAHDPIDAVISYFGGDIDKKLDQWNLTDKEKEIIKLRFGLDDGIPRTLEQVGKIHSVTRERIRQIEFRALNKARFAVLKEQAEELRLEDGRRTEVIEIYNKMDEIKHSGAKRGPA